jgi:tetratricopeptide (TPR) repeat protein
VKRFLGGVLYVLFLVSGRAETVVVLPFHTRAADSAWIGEALADSLWESLYDAGLLALDRDSRNEGYRRLSLRPGAELTKASALRIGETLDADTVVTGSFDVAGKDSDSGAVLVIRAQVLDRHHVRQSPVLSVDGRLADLRALEHRLAWLIIRCFDTPVPAWEDYLKRFHPARTEAIENYIRGLLAEDAGLKQRCLLEAVRLDPAFAPPCFQLGKLHWSKREYRQAADWLARAASSGARRLEAQFFLGLCRLHLGEYERADEAFRLVAESVPLNEVWNNLGAAQSRLDRPEALESFRRALAGDPSDTDYNFNTGYVLWKLGRFAEAADRFRAVLAAIPEDMQATSMLGRCLKQSRPRKRDARTQSLERLKTNYDELAYRQLQTALSGASRTAGEP